MNLDKIVKSFDMDPADPKIPKTVWRVKVDGRFISTLSRKTVWKQIGHAKNAVIQHIEGYLSCVNRDTDPFRSARLDGKTILAKLIELGRLEFVELDV